tara:strand:- start:3884 stop:3991 length:108 start_codon:yes stop_codon:yes gene_type:complete
MSKEEIKQIIYEVAAMSIKYLMPLYAALFIYMHVT